MKEYFSENYRRIISNKVIQAEYAILLLNYSTLPSIRNLRWKEASSTFQLYLTAQMRKLRCKVIIGPTQDKTVSGQYRGQNPSLLTPRLITTFISTYCTHIYFKL